MPARLEVEVALEAAATLGERPVWDARAGELVWVDILASAVHRFDPASGRDVASDVGRPVGAAVPREGGGLVLAVEDGFAVTSEDGGEVELIAPVGADDPSSRFNDGACDPEGRFWAGTMAYDESPGAGALYRLDPDHRVERLLDGVTISNGIGWSPDGVTMYYIDSPTRGVDAFDYDASSGSIGGRRRVLDVPEAAGMPDGLAVDAEGGLWVVLNGGSAVHRYRPDGDLVAIVIVPTPNVTSCCFGGPTLEDLFVTSARDGLDEGQLASEPLAGAVFRCRPGVSGLPNVAFRG